SRLSVGGMAELFLAFTAGPGGFRKFVALKQILPDVQKSDEFVRMFLDEARITAAFSHANIGQVFDLGEEDGELYLALEFLSGQNLEQISQAALQRQHRLPTGFAARVVRDVCLALHYAHHFTDPTGRPVPVVHRDVSQKNVMVTYDGNVKVIDFGIAKVRGRIGRTQVGMVRGTTGYMSPEQVHGFEVDGRSDLFCAGILLHELLCGRRLFHGPNEHDVMLKIAQVDVTPPAELEPRVPRALSDVVMRALARSPSERFGSGREMARALEAACGAEFFHEEQMAVVMRQLFQEKIQQTRALLERANRPDEGVGPGAAWEPQDELAPVEEPTRRVPRPTRGSPRRLTSTEMVARQGPRTTARVRSLPAPPPTDEAEALESEDEMELTRPIRRWPAQAPRAPASAPVDEEEPLDEMELTRPVALRVPPRRAAPSSGSGWGPWLLGLLFLAVLGGWAAFALKHLGGEGSAGDPPPREPVILDAPEPRH
ncbi:MAG TPA: protein kinase, partial [Myxococcaceae bacterium]|nr:protein kinase [Myxococcaceae bacterium]